MAHNPDSSAEQRFRDEMTSTNEDIRKAAAESLAILSGVTNPRGVVFEAIEKRGFDALTEPQKQFYAVFIYDAEVRNGGHSQYFWNSSGNTWKSADSGLAAIGAGHRAKVLQDAVVLFGVSGPSENRRQRQDQLKIVEKDNKLLDDLDKRYYASKENVDVLLSLYAIANKSHFVANMDGE